MMSHPVDSRAPNRNVLTGGTSNEEARASIHRSTTDADGRPTMQPVERLEVPSGVNVESKLGNPYVILEDPPTTRDAGDAPITIASADANGDYEVGHYGRAAAFSPDNLAHRLYGFDVRPAELAQDLPRLVTGTCK